MPVPRQRVHGLPPEQPVFAFLHASHACDVLPFLLSLLADWVGRGVRIEGIATFPSGGFPAAGLAIPPPMRDGPPMLCALGCDSEDWPAIPNVEKAGVDGSL